MATKIGNKTVVVTGGSRGIGLEWVKHFLQEGNTVVATARSAAKSLGLQELSQTYADKLIVTEVDTASPESIIGWAEGLKGKIEHIDVLINNAGAGFEKFEYNIADVSASILNDTFAVNTVGPFLVVQELLKQDLLGGSRPSLCIHTSSIMASIGGFAFPQAKMYAYRASKTALNMLVRASVEELTPKNITSVLLHPGYVATDMTAGHSGTISTAESIAGQVKLLEDGRPLNDKFYSYTGEELAW